MSKPALALVSPCCKFSSTFFSFFVSAVEVVPDLPAMGTTVTLHTCSILVTMLPHPAGLSHHSMEPPLNSCAQLYQKSEPRECMTLGGSGFISGHTLPFLFGSMTLYCLLPGLVTATIRLTLEPLHMQFALPGPTPCPML